VSYRWVDHTAELELEVEAEDEAGIYAQAVQALAELLADDAARAPTLRQITVTARDRGALLVAWLDELVYLAETQDLIPAEVERLTLSERDLKATARLVHGQPRHVVKGATYHRLLFAPTPTGYRARVVLDV
jgi:SHS2 domain-containing protein